MSKKKFIIKNVRKRKYYLFALLACFIFIGLGYAIIESKLNIEGTIIQKRYVSDDNILYNVLENAAIEGTYAREYVDEHQDSFTSTGTKKIYYWYGSNETNGAAIQDKNNVIFAGHCWQMIRTTDTGGVKMIYNGEASNNQCQNTRGTHVGYSRTSGNTMTSNYYYGTNYEFRNNQFYLSGDIIQATWDETIGPTLVGKYTCLSTSSTSCSTLYLVATYGNSTRATLLILSNSSNYSRYGVVPFGDRDHNSLAFVGYMFNTYYPISSVGAPQLRFSSSSSWNIDSSYYYSDTLDYNDTNENNYTLLNPVQISTLDDYSELVGKYVLETTETYGQNARYVLGVSDNTLYYRTLSDGDLNIYLTIGSSYAENDGIYTINNATTITYSDWYNGATSSYRGKYMCEGDSSSCNVLKYIISCTKDTYTYNDTSKTYYFSENVSYEDGIYTLTGDIKKEWNYYSRSSTFNTHHYTCLADGTSCSTLGYFSYVRTSMYYCVMITGASDIQDAIQKMLYDENVNVKNSAAKTGVDAWYKKYLTDYDEYIEDTIYCNDRTISTIAGWNPNGGKVSDYLYFKASSDTSLNCPRVTDQFSTLNPLAQLTYKVGLMSYAEMKLLNSNSVRSSGSSSWLISPYAFMVNDAYLSTINTSGNFSNNSWWSGSVDGIRPAISLKYGVKFLSGDGSKSRPYLIQDGNNMSYRIKIDSNLFNAPSYAPSGQLITINSDDYYVTSFKMNGTLVEDNSFVMPAENVIITDIQYIPANYSITSSNPDLIFPVTGRYGSTIILTMEGYRVTSFKMNGTLVTGNSFVMPAEDVTITDVTFAEQITVESDHNPYANNINNVVYYENTFVGATSINVELTYQTESTTYDWIYLYDAVDSTTPFGNKKYGGTTKKTETITINSNYLKIVFRTDGSTNNYYGFKAVITPNYE